jgi:hypothetical protein
LTYSRALLRGWQHLEERVDSVVEGAADLFCKRLFDNVRDSVKLATSDMIHGRVNPLTGKPVQGQQTSPFLLLYTRCFRWIVETHPCKKPVEGVHVGRLSSDAREDHLESLLSDLVQSLKEACDPLLQQGKDAAQGAGKSLVRLVEWRSLMRSLRREAPALPTQLDLRARSGLFRPQNDDQCKYISCPNEVSNVLRCIRLVASDVQSAASARKLELQLRKNLPPALKLGSGVDGPWGLFDSLGQLMLGQRGGVGEEERRQLRLLLVTAVVERCQPERPADLRHFCALRDELDGGGHAAAEGAKGVEAWAHNMLNEDKAGDLVALDSFARHFRVKVLLFSTKPLSRPLAFPVAVRGEGRLHLRRGWLVLAHAQWRIGGFLPIWPAEGDRDASAL